MGAGLSKPPSPSGKKNSLYSVADARDRGGASGDPSPEPHERTSWSRSSHARSASSRPPNPTSRASASSTSNARFPRGFSSREPVSSLFVGRFFVPNATFSGATARDALEGPASFSSSPGTSSLPERSLAASGWWTVPGSSRRRRLLLPSRSLAATPRRAGSSTSNFFARRRERGPRRGREPARLAPVLQNARAQKSVRTARRDAEQRRRRRVERRERRDANARPHARPHRRERGEVAERGEAGVVARWVPEKSAVAVPAASLSSRRHTGCAWVMTTEAPARSAGNTAPRAGAGVAACVMRSGTPRRRRARRPRRRPRRSRPARARRTPRAG